MHEMSREGTSSADWDDSEGSINNPEDVYFRTFNTHFISLVSVRGFLFLSLSDSQGEPYTTMPTALCSDGKKKPCHVITLPYMLI